jgi:AAA+ ATPase superfamily predicted ATPase
MKFYGREAELETLEQNRAQSVQTAACTVLTGRRRIGKTALLLEAIKDTRYLYLLVCRQPEPLLCAEFQRQAETVLGLRIVSSINRFRDLFEELLRRAQTEPYTLVIDEFQELERINPAIPGECKSLWDRYKDRAKINLIASGSMHYGGEPFPGGGASHIHLRPFTAAAIQRILKQYNRACTAEDLLCLYMISGGVPRYIALLMDSGAVTAYRMLQMTARPDSPFLNEGRELLVAELGRDYGTYFSILRLIAAGTNSQSGIDSIIGKNTGAYLANLEREYSLITKIKPLFSRPESRDGRWKIDDLYLRFWFRFIYPNQSLIETGQNALLLKIIKRDYEAYSGLILEDYFHDKLSRENEAATVGSFWSRTGEHAIALIVLNDSAKTALAAEIKRNPKKIQLAALQEKTARIGNHLAGYTVEYRGLSMEDIMEDMLL